MIRLNWEFTAFYVPEAAGDQIYLLGIRDAKKLFCETESLHLPVSEGYTSLEAKQLREKK